MDPDDYLNALHDIEETSDSAWIEDFNDLTDVERAVGKLNEARALIDSLIADLHAHIVRLDPYAGL